MTQQQQPAEGDSLKPITDEKAREAAHLSDEEIERAIERGRRALAELENAPRSCVTVDPGLRFLTWWGMTLATLSQWRPDEDGRKKR